MAERREPMEKLVSRMEASYVPCRGSERVCTKPGKAIVERSIDFARSKGFRLEGRKLTIHLPYRIGRVTAPEHPVHQEPIRNRHRWIKRRRPAADVLDFELEATQIGRVVVAVNPDPQGRTVEQVTKELNRV